MKLPQNIKTFLRSLPLRNMRGEDILVAIAFFLSGGSKDAEIAVKDIARNWSKTLFGKSFHNTYVSRAHGRVHPLSKGKISLTDEGVDYIERLCNSTSSTLTTLRVFKKGSTHSFDKFVREAFREAGAGVDIADTYVSGAIFDTLLNDISEDIPIRLVYGNDVGGFMARAVRFGKQYNFSFKQANSFHDRFIIIDGKGYIIGPSLKDAADKKPATVVLLGKNDSKDLIELFDSIWM